MTEAITIKAPFRILGFSSVQRGPSRSGFSIILDASIAERLASVKRSEGSPLLEDMRKIIEQSFEQKADANALQFHGDSWLLSGLRVPGDCACFTYGQPKTSFDRDIRYNPHNINNRLQAATLLAVWLEWWEAMAVAVLKIEQPFCV